ncbi:MAG: hypothetical protein HQ592_15380 [Planctomycetes bacterium]|nr:hypothetical protein [Planctomycetota bacterium]
MTIETSLAITSLVIAVGGFFFLRNRRKKVALAIWIAALIVTNAGALYRHHQHNQLISRVQNDIISELSYKRWTFDQLYEGLHYVPFQIVNEALFSAVRKGLIGCRMIEFRDPTDNSIQQVRVYYVDSSP